MKSIDSPVGREFYNRIGVVLSSSVDFDRLILYAPNSGFAFGTIISGGEYFFLARNEKELKRVFNTDVRWADRAERQSYLYSRRNRGKSTSCCISSSIWKTA